MEKCSSAEILDVESSPFAAEDYVQMACSLRRSADMRVSYPDGTSGGIVVNKGELWHAWDNLGGGSEAFLRMIGLARVTRIRSLAPSDATSRSISESCQKLLLQALIEHDALGAGVPPLPKTPLPKTPLPKTPLPHPNMPPTSTSAYATNVSDSELTRPNWSVPLSGVTLNSASEAEATTARSHTERPVAMDATPMVKPRSISTFLRQPSVLQRGVAALFGAILLGSVGQILASPAGGEGALPHNQITLADAHREQVGTSTPANAKAATLTRSVGAGATHTRTGVSGQASEMVFTVSALQPVDWSQPSTVVTRVHSVSATGALETNAAARHVVSATAQFSTCYDWAATRSPVQSGLGNISVAVNIDEDGSVASASSRGGKLPGLNTCVAQVAERLGTLLQRRDGPSRLAWTVSYLGADSPTNSVGSEIH